MTKPFQCKEALRDVTLFDRENRCFTTQITAVKKVSEGKHLLLFARLMFSEHLTG